MTTAVDVATELKRTTGLQLDAADPLSSAWVSANAGTGKTHVLKTRVHRLMLAGAKPEKIMCLTYTKAAAAEMSQRIFNDLSTWVTLPDKDLKAILKKLIGNVPDDAQCARARTLFASAIETPGGLQVQTIHAFCERLLKRFPLEAGLAADFTVLDDDTSRLKLAEAVDTVLLRAAADRDGPLGTALQSAIRFAVDDRFVEILREALGHRPWLRFAARVEDGDGTDDLATARTFLMQSLGLAPTDSEDTVLAECAALMTDAEIETAFAVLEAGKKTDQKLAAALSDARKSQTPDARAGAFARAFLKADGTAFADRFITKAIRDDRPDIAQRLTDARDQCERLNEKRQAFAVLDATLSIQRLAREVMQKYEDAKARAAALDFDDLIEHTRNLLLRPGGADWVLYKLDGGIEHVLVDESQDTSPEQWQIVEQLTDEFFAGGGAHDAPRTLFAVGDKKQSIYSFQGADPEKFAQMGALFRERAGAAGMPWNDIPLNLSFRTVAPVLNAVDAVFADPNRTPGVAKPDEAIRHIAKRQGQAGLVEIWPTETWEETDAADAWSPLADTAARAPATRLAGRIAETIDGWFQRGELLQSHDRAVRPGDILILVRKRNPFAGPMVAALKQRGIPVAGADRMTLTDQIAVQDLMALGDFLTLPEDDFALACALKSPFFDLTDDDLLALAPDRGAKTLWRALLDSAQTNDRYAAVATQLKSWRARADFIPPFELFAEVLDNTRHRARMLERLGPEAADPLDEFLNLALNHDQQSPPSLSGFLEWLRGADRTIKRDMEHGRDEVRILTVHGAKGLEAPIVFLPDTCGARGGGNDALLRLHEAPLAPGAPPPFVWNVKGASKISAVAKAKSDRNERDTMERNRLLYVAMTRARDRLYVAGYEGKRGRDENCWYDLISDALEGDLHDAKDAAGLPVRRLHEPQAEGIAPDGDVAGKEPEAPQEDLPGWALSTAPRPRRLSMPLAPSSLVPYEIDDEGEVHAPVSPPEREQRARDEPPVIAPSQVADDSRFLRGTLTHALLEHLPAIEPSRRSLVAAAFVDVRAANLSERVRASIVEESLKVLADPAFAAVFGPRSRAEVAVAAELPRPDGKGPSLRLNGAIDRLAETGDDVLIIDYKTNRAPPNNVADVADVYLYQLAAYCLSLRQIYPDKAIRAAFIWTAAPSIMEIPVTVLDEYAKKLWTLDPDRLDV